MNSSNQLVIIFTLLSHFLHSFRLQVLVWTFWAYQQLATIFFDCEMNKILLPPCHLLPRMPLAHSWLNGLQKPYDLMVFLHTTGDAKKARHYLARMTKTAINLWVLMWNMNWTFYWLAIYDLMIQAISWQLTHSAYGASYLLLNTHIALQDFPQFTDGRS